MQLFERVKRVAVDLAGSETKLAQAINLPQRTFNNYLNAKSQRNLWEHLPTILRVYPIISRDWLYFGEGNMLLDDVSPLTTVQSEAHHEIERLRSENASLQAELREERALNRQLTWRLMGTAEKTPLGQPAPTGDTAAPWQHAGNNEG